MNMRVTAERLVDNADVQTIRSAIKSLNAKQLIALSKSWMFWGREEQQPPSGDWATWMFLGGRGTGKTRAGAEWVKNMMTRYPGIRAALVGPTRADVRDTMIHGVSGLMSLNWESGERPVHIPSRRGIFWPNGSIAHTYSAEEPERLRGPNHHISWCDELTAWRYIEDAWDMLQFGLRLEYPDATTPRCVVTTTPRPIALVRQLLEDSNTVTTRGSTYRNRANLSPKFFSQVISSYEGTRLGRQELEGILIEDMEDALWSRSLIDKTRIRKDQCPQFQSLIISVDPAASDAPKANECGIIAVGLAELDQVTHGYVCGDHTTHGRSPEVWGNKIVHLYNTLQADYVVVEGNLGGGLVQAVIRQINPNIPLKFVQARRGKYLRADPVQLLYEVGRVHHVGQFAELEDQMCRFTSTYQKDNPGMSPDRVDALVWGITELMLDPSYSGTGSMKGLY